MPAFNFEHTRHFSFISLFSIFPQYCSLQSCKIYLSYRLPEKCQPCLHPAFPFTTKCVAVFIGQAHTPSPTLGSSHKAGGCVWGVWRMEFCFCEFVIQTH